MIKSLFEYLPLVLFFGLTHFYGIKAATIALVVCTIVQVIVYRLAGWTFNSIQRWSLIAILILAPISLFLDNPLILKMKPTVVFTLLPLVSLIALKWKKINWIERMYREAMGNHDTPLPNPQHPFWTKALWKTSIFFLFLSTVNAGVAIYATDQQWAGFKLFGITSMSLLFFTYLSISVVRTAESLIAGRDV